MVAGRIADKQLDEGTRGQTRTKKAPWSTYEAALLKLIDYALNKHSNAAMRVEALMEALRVPAERWQSSLSDNVFGRVATVTTLAARERAAAPAQAPAQAPPLKHTGPRTGERYPDQPTRDQPARAKKAKR